MDASSKLWSACLRPLVVCMCVCVCANALMWYEVCVCIAIGHFIAFHTGAQVRK